MHFRRVLVVAVALLAAFGITASVGAAPTQAAAKERHRVIVNAGEIRNSGTFQVYGRSSTAAGQRIYLQRKNCRRCGYRNIKSMVMGRPLGRYLMKFDGPVGSCYRLWIRKSSRYYAYGNEFGCITRG